VILLPAVFPKRGGARHAPTGRPIVDVFLEHAESHAIPATDCLITAHNRADLPAKNRRPVGNPATMLAHARRVVHAAVADQAVVDDACRIGARTLLRYWFPDVPEQGSLEARCTAAGVEFGELIRRAYGFLYALPGPTGDWSKSVNLTLKRWPRPAAAAPRGNAGKLGGKPEGLRAAATPVPFRSDNIHQVKGDEHDGVLLLIPDDDVSSRWINGDPATDEMLRNWYVAVTRARRLISVGVAEDHIEVLARHLRAQGVPAAMG
jgi:DNA helicase-2/ATP-dependent DNA helicase PcrA